ARRWRSRNHGKRCDWTEPPDTDRVGRLVGMLLRVTDLPDLTVVGIECDGTEFAQVSHVDAAADRLVLQDVTDTAEVIRRVGGRSPRPPNNEVQGDLARGRGPTHAPNGLVGGLQQRPHPGGMRMAGRSIELASLLVGGHPGTVRAISARSSVNSTPPNPP